MVMSEHFDREEALDRLNISRARPNDTGFRLDLRGLPVFPVAEPTGDAPLPWISVSMRRLRSWIPGRVRWR
jgi:hypothetical protein